MKKSLQLWRHPLARVVLLLVVCWAAAFLGPVSYLIGPAVLVALWRAWRQRAWVACVLLLVLNPVSGVFAGGVAAYLGDAPCLGARQLPTLEAYNPDPANRCSRRLGGCLRGASEWLSIDTYNSALLLMCRCGGPPAQAYDGPYPTKDEALAQIDQALLTPVDPFLKGRVLADGAMVKLQPAVATGLAGLVGLKDDEATPIHTKLYQERCVILRFSRRPGPSEAAAAGCDVLVLMDRRKQRPFAYYKLTGDALPTIPPVTYLE